MTIPTNAKVGRVEQIAFVECGVYVDQDADQVGDADRRRRGHNLIRLIAGGDVSGPLDRREYRVAHRIAGTQKIGQPPRIGDLQPRRLAQQGQTGV